MSQKIGRASGEKTKRNPIPHHKCNGTGYGTKVYARCRGCGGTGDAAVAFAAGVEARWSPRATFADNDALDEMLELYLEARYGVRCRSASFTLGDQLAGQIFTVLQHSIDRAALESIVRLSGHGALFPWLVEQEKRHMVGMEAEDFTW